MNSTRRQMTLKTRITVSFVLLMVAVMAFVVVAEQLDYDELRAYLISESLRNEAHRLEADLAKGIMPTLTEGSRFHDAKTVPDVLRQYAPGYHRVKVPDAWHLLVFELKDQRYYLLQDGASYDYLEHVIDGYALVVILLCILCAFWIGRLTSARVTVPIIRLAEAVQRKQKPFPFLDARDEIGVLARAFAQRLRLDRDREASRDLNRLLNKPGSVSLETAFCGQPGNRADGPAVLPDGAGFGAWA